MEVDTYITWLIIKYKNRKVLKLFYCFDITIKDVTWRQSLCTDPFFLRKPWHPNNPSIYILITCFNLCKANLTLIIANRRGHLILLYLKKNCKRLSLLVISELTQQDGGKKRTAKRSIVCDKREGAITCESCRNLHLTWMFSGLYEKTRLKATSPRLLIKHDTSLPSFKLNFFKLAGAETNKPFSN